MGKGRVGMKVRLRSENLEKILVKRNISVRTFAHSLGYDSGTVSQWFTQKRYPRPRSRQKIEDFLQADWDELFEMVKEDGISKHKI